VDSLYNNFNFDNMRNSNEEISRKAQGSESLASDSVHSDAAAQHIAFLSSFSPEEDKAIRRKVDWRFPWLIGMMYIIKNVSIKTLNLRLFSLIQRNTDRLHQRRKRQSPPSRQAFEYSYTAQNDSRSVQLGTINLFCKCKCSICLTRGH